MFGDLAGYNRVGKDDASEEYNALVDAAVKRILEESFERVSHLLTVKDKELRNLAKALYKYDYLDAVEMDLVIRGEEFSKEKENKKVRDWDKEKYGGGILAF